MRPLEIAIPLLLGVSLLWPLHAPWIVALAVLVVLVHLVVEKYRWQMVPLYVLSGLLLLINLGNPIPALSDRASAFAVGDTLLSMVLLGAATALPWLMPVPRSPAPTGRYSVGTVTRFLVDDSRRELYSGIDEPRQFVIQVWYPAKPGRGAKPALWMPDARQLGRLISAWIKMPRFFLDHASLVRSHSYQDAPLDASGGAYPVLLFSHGWGGFRAQNTYQTQELASHGYVVVGIEHPYGSMVTVFPDGRVVRNNPSALPYRDPEPQYLPAARKLASQWAGDIGFALDYLAAVNRSDPGGRLTGALDMDRIGLFGHSTGAGAVLEFIGTDHRPRACLAEDIYFAPVSERVLGTPLTQPLVFMFSQAWADDRESDNNRTLRKLERSLRGPYYVMSVRGTTHYDFTDLPSLSPLAHMLGLKGPIHGKRVHQIVNAYSLAFFDTFLRGSPSLLLTGPQAEYPEVLFEAAALQYAVSGEQPDDERGERSPEQESHGAGTDEKEDGEGERAHRPARAEPVRAHQGQDQDCQAPEERDDGQNARH
jgi:predicted dienelactone hydrolase